MANNQLNTIIKHLETVGSISTLEAIIQYNIMALPRRIKDLKEKVYNFNSIRKSHPVTGQRYTRYVLAEEAA